MSAETSSDVGLRSFVILLVGVILLSLGLGAFYYMKFFHKAGGQLASLRVPQAGKRWRPPVTPSLQVPARPVVRTQANAKAPIVRTPEPNRQVVVRARPTMPEAPSLCLVWGRVTGKDFSAGKKTAQKLSRELRAQWKGARIRLIRGEDWRVFLGPYHRGKQGARKARHDYATLRRHLHVHFVAYGSSMPESMEPKSKAAPLPLRPCTRDF